MSIEDEVKELAERAAADPTYDARCVQGEKVFFAGHTHAIAPGHIYSPAGVEEYRISQACEYHFDQWFADEE